MRYNRIVVGYHGCDIEVAARILDGDPFVESANDYDWIGRGVYFWEYGADRAYRFAQEQVERGRVRTPAVLGALIQLGECFDLLDTRFTRDLSEFYGIWEEQELATGRTLPTNSGKTPDKKMRRLDCAVINHYLMLAAKKHSTYDTVRGCFIEGEPVFAGSGIYQESHIQIAVRNPASVVGAFKPR